MATSAPATVVLIHLSVGPVFVSEGAQKFLFPAEARAGRFAKIGIPSPEAVAPFVGVVEIVRGALVLLSLFTRLAVAPLAAVMLAAIISTKVPLLLGHGFWGFSLRQLPYYGFWGWRTRRTD